MDTRHRHVGPVVGLVSLLAVILALGPGRASALQAGGGNSVRDSSRAYADDAARELIERAREARRARAAGLTSFETTFRERVYAGLSGEALRRERAMFHQERAARIYWDADGGRIVRWLGLRRGVPIVGMEDALGDDPADDDGLELDLDFLDPSEERIVLGDDWALNPLADSASLHYRYASGDTLRIELPGSDRRVTLAELRIEPFVERFDRIIASMWFDTETAVLVRAVYRPARAYDLEEEEDEDAEDVPGFLRPIRMTVDYITVDYGLQELSWWLPNRLAFDGQASAAGLLEMPVRLEWRFDQYIVDEATTIDTLDLPEGWTRSVSTEEDPEEGEETLDADSLPARPTRTIEIIPPRDSLRMSRELPRPLMSAGVEAFSEAELDELRSRLDPLGPLESAAERTRAALGPLGAGMFRFNRVEGVSSGGRIDHPLGRGWSLDLSGRVGIPEFEPGAVVALRHESPGTELGFGVYRRLTDLGDWGRPLGFGNSMNGLLFGYDWGQYFRQTGAEVTLTRVYGRGRWQLRLFGERQQNAAKQTDASIPHLIGSRVFPDNVAADRGEVAGLAGRMRWFSGVDDTKPVLSTTVWGEGVTGDFEFARLAAAGALLIPVSERVQAALELGGGTTAGTLPAQRLYHLGGHYTLRGFEAGFVAGEAFWNGRAELGLGLPVGNSRGARALGAVRLVGFTDLAWAGGRGDFRLDDPFISAGVGASLADGLLRFDLAHAVRGGDTWRLHVYSDALF